MQLFGKAFCDIFSHWSLLILYLSISDKQTPIPIHIESISDSPVGSGLGTSSTLTVALVKALSDLFEVSLNRYEIAKLAYMEGLTAGMRNNNIPTITTRNLRIEELYKLNDFEYNKQQEKGVSQRLNKND